MIDSVSIEVSINNTTYPVRYIGIKKPEADAQFKSQARASNVALVEGKMVTLISDTSEHDNKDRLLRYVLVGENFVNHQLVRNGYAEAQSYPPDTSCDLMLSLAQTEAQLDKLGFWHPSISAKPIPESIQPTKPASSAVCNCSGPDLNCDHFGAQSQAQACFNYCKSIGLGDIFQLDSDNDGIACEDLP